MSYQITNTGFNIGDNPCGDKTAFMTEAQANAAKIQAKHDHDNQNLAVYLCDKCDLYHLSTNHDTDD